MRIISGTFKNRTILAPKSLLVRPTSESLRESLFNICRNIIQEAKVLDLFAGSGAIGLEALSRGATHITFVDNNRDAIRCIRYNIQSLEVQSQTEVITGDVLRSLDNLIQQGRKFDVIFADPPYEKGPLKGLLYSQMVLDKVDFSTLLNPSGELFIEDAESVKLQCNSLNQLFLKSSRKYGTTSLHHFKPK